MNDTPIDFQKERNRLAKELGLDYGGNADPVFWQQNKQTEQAKKELEALMAQSTEGKKAQSQDATAAPQAYGYAREDDSETIFSNGRTTADSDGEAVGCVPPMQPQALPWTLRCRAFVNSLRRFAQSRLERRQAAGVDAQKKEKSRQVGTALLCAAALFGFAVAAVYVASDERVGSAAPVRVYKSDFRLEPDALDKQSYQKQYDEKLENVTARLRTMEELALRLQQELKVKQEENRTGEKTVAEPTAAKSKPVNELADFRAEARGFEAARLSEAIARTNVVPEGPVLKRLAVADPVKDLEAIRSAAQERFRPLRAAAADSLIAANRARHEAAGTYLPAGSFARAVVLAGATVSTGGTSASNPVPMLLEIKDTARLPNAFRSNVKACFVTANATGDLSSERVWIRLERLSCMTQSGKAFDARIQGYVTGDDGKTGVRARLVTRSGQAIAGALLTGSISGLGKAVSLSAQSTTTYSSGAVGTTVSDSFRAGLGEGMQSALERIADYYIRLADKIFPCLEIDSGRRVDLILSQGLTLEMQENVSGGDERNARAPAREQTLVNNSELFGSQMRAQSERYE